MGSAVSPELAARVHGDRVLAGFLSPLPRLAEREEADLGQTFERFGQLASRSRLTARVVFQVRAADGTDPRPWSLELTPGACQVSAGAAHRPDLTVLVGEATWRQLAASTVSPLEAFATGELRVRGNVRLASQLVELVRGE